MVTNKALSLLLVGASVSLLLLPSSTGALSLPGRTAVKIGPYEIRSVENEQEGPLLDLSPTIISMQDTASGWGNGQHPTTRLCCEFVLETVKPGDRVLDYGTGSGILSILAMRCGAHSCVAVDIDEASLVAAQRNAFMNGYDSAQVDVVHTKHVYIGESRFPLSDVVIANILPGPLSRLVAPLWGLSKPGARLCLSGMRPAELPAIRSIYAPFVDLNTEKTRQLSHAQFGDWVAWSVDVKTMSQDERSAMRNRLTESSME